MEEIFRKDFQFQVLKFLDMEELVLDGMFTLPFQDQINQVGVVK